jgi:hypothetical protein
MPYEYSPPACSVAPTFQVTEVFGMIHSQMLSQWSMSCWALFSVDLAFHVSLPLEWFKSGLMCSFQMHGKTASPPLYVFQALGTLDGNCSKRHGMAIGLCSTVREHSWIYVPSWVERSVPTHGIAVGPCSTIGEHSWIHVPSWVEQYHSVVPAMERSMPPHGIAVESCSTGGTMLNICSIVSGTPLRTCSRGAYPFQLWWNTAWQAFHDSWIDYWVLFPNWNNVECRLFSGLNIIHWRCLSNDTGTLQTQCQLT